MQIEQYRDALLLLMVGIAAVNDLATRRIPNRLLLAGLAGALLLHALSAEPGVALLSACGGMLLGLAVFLPFYLVRGMAAGDVKMMAVIGFFTGPAEAFQIAVFTWCAGGVMALFLILLRSRVRLAFVNIGHLLSGLIVPGTKLSDTTLPQSAGSMPYGLAIAFGTIAALVTHYG
ncbi:A24 family peptidase [Massilia putida]|uniref:A24 family peptidase n=1 Tax=Massilia putida TaxID=1141883 RepID=UPI00095350CE|nr:prepilin peptidase [Massilia putida]